MTSSALNSARRRSLATVAVMTALSAGWGRAAVAAPDAPLRIGLTPYLSTTALLAVFRPLREHLERALARPIEMVTAKDFSAHIEATRRGDYDAVLLPAHIARLAVTDWHYEALASAREPVTVQVLVRTGGLIKNVADLRGGKAGMLDALSLVATVGRQWLQEQGLAASVTVVAVPSINSGMISLDRGEVEAVMAASTQLMNLPASTPRTERVLASVRDIPGPVYVAHPRLVAAEVLALRAALLAFQPDPARSATTTNAALHALTAEQLAPLEPLAVQVRRVLAQRP